MKSLPSKNDYRGFMENFVRGISRNFLTTCFFTYGSINNGDCVYGRSDIDGGIILDSGIVTPKDTILRLGELLSSALGNRLIKTEFNLLDRETCRDGRFMSYTADYTSWIKQAGRVYGADYRDEMNGKDFKSGTLNAASFNFCGPRGVRKALLYFGTYVSRGGDGFVEHVAEALEKTAKFPKKLLWLRTGEVVPSRREARQKLEKLLGVGLETIDRLNVLLDNPERFYAEIGNRKNASRLLVESLDCMEKMVSSYLRLFPQIGEREMRQ